MSNITLEGIDLPTWDSPDITGMARTIADDTEKVTDENNGHEV